MAKTMKDIIKYFYFKNNKTNQKVLSSILEQVEVDEKDIECSRSQNNYDDYITCMDEDYPTELKNQGRPPFVIPRKHKLIRGVLVDTINSYISEYYFVSHDNDLHDIYYMLGCSCIDVQERTIGTRRYDIYLDDEGLFKENQKPSVVTTDKNGTIIEVIVGRVFICGVDREEGKMKSLTDEEVKEIKNTTIKVSRTDLLLSTCVHAHV